MPRKTRENPLGLEPYGGSAVAKVGVTIGNAGGGLHAPLAIDPEFAASVAKTTFGDTRYFLIRADCNSDGHKPIVGKEDQVQLTVGFHATDTVMLLDDNDWAVDRINAERDKIMEAEEAAAAGQREKLFGKDGQPAEPVDAADQG